MKRIVKAFLIFLISYFSAFSLSAEESCIRWFTPGAPDLSAQWGFSIPFKGDLRNPAPSEDFILAADYGELRLKSGIKYQYNQLDSSNTVIYMPTLFDAFQTGFGFNWHFYRYLNEFTENDLTVTTRFRWIKGPVFSFENAAGFLFKFASIDAIKEYKPCVFNLSYQFELLCNWHVLNRADIWCALNLQDFFDYPLAISPFYKFGFDFTAASGIVLGLDYTLKFVDMFFSAVYLNESLLRFTFKVEI